MTNMKNIKQFPGCPSSAHVGHQVDNSNSTIQKLNMLYCDPELSDLRLLVGDNTFHAHKLILSISSDVFKTMLTNPTWPEAFTSQIALQEEPECVEVFEIFLRYLYTGRINLSHLSVLPVLILADKYNINDLSEVCINYMCSHYVAPQSQSQVVSWLNYAMMCEHKNLLVICEQYIMWNFQFVSETADFMNISPDLLIKFLKSSEIVVNSEYLLYQRVKDWIQQKTSRKELKSCSKKPISNLENIVSQISRLIRFNMMTLAEIDMIEKDDLISQFSEIFQPMLSAAKQFNQTSSSMESSGRTKETGKTSPAFDCASNKGGINSVDISNNDHCIDRNTEGTKLLLAYPTPSISDHSDHNSYPHCHRPFLCKTGHSSSSYSKQYLPFSPRLYTCDTWCTEMSVSDVCDRNPGHVSGAFFSTPVTGSEADDSCWDWHIDLYPKGVIFKKCMVIGLYWNCDIDEVTYDTVRLTVTANTSQLRKVQVSILVLGKQDGLEYFAKGITRTCYFDDSCASHNFNEVVDFSEIHSGKSQYLTGEENSLRLKIIIRPLL